MKYKLKVYTILEQGQRENQEDCIFPAKNKESENDRLFILCDGMGGHEAGEVASGKVCEAMSQYILGNYEPEGSFSESDMQRAVDAAFDALDGLEADDLPQKRKMGTTMTCLKLHDKGCTIAHIGDSRVYHIRPKEDGSAEILFVTRDHSLVNDLIAIGELTEEEAKHSKQKNVITRAMQPNMERRPQADIYENADIKAGDYFYLCSDGMLENMDDGNICYQFSDKISGGADAKVGNLVQATSENQDNHSAIIVHIREIILDESNVEQQDNVSGAELSDSGSDGERQENEEYNQISNDGLHEERNGEVIEQESSEDEKREEKSANDGYKSGGMWVKVRDYFTGLFGKTNNI